MHKLPVSNMHIWETAWFVLVYLHSFRILGGENTYKKGPDQTSNWKIVINCKLPRVKNMRWEKERKRNIEKRIPQCISMEEAAGELLKMLATTF